jgi:hypothetical protein
MFFGETVRASAMSHSAKAGGVRRRWRTEQTLIPGGTGPRGARRLPEHQCVGSLGTGNAMRLVSTRTM